ncbi:metal ABC transporter permease [bacterium]|nr:MULTISPECIES: metal ABC transporter permease [Pirellulaceae]MDB4339170.1 metal ABC transporter permease [Rubripirellula sp.]MDB4676608.1 metal ABC transporter permease [bacterium]MDB4679241.1 metal ABC transporter permease [Rhodopirellula sp.]
MTLDLNWNWMLDGWITAVAVVCAIACALLGNFLVLRRMSMLGDAITHAVLPGLAVAFLISDSRASLPMFIGAAIVGVLTAFFTEWIRRAGKVDEGASMGVVFTTLFAIGLVMIVQTIDQVDLDANCVLYGSIELTPLDTIDVAGWQIPRAFCTLFLVMLINLTFVIVFYKELKVTSFDPSLAGSIGFSPAIIHYALMVLVAITAVASFESVGSVLVVAMMVVPAATAYLLTHRLHIMICFSILAAIISAVAGHVSAIAIPASFGFRSTSTAGMMAVISGLLLFLAAMFAPRQGIAVKLWNQLALSWHILGDDIVALLYRVDEKQANQRTEKAWIREVLLCSPLSFTVVMTWLRIRGEIVIKTNELVLTDQGQHRAQNLVRSHRLWEQYLLDQVGIDPSRVHPQAEQMEHYTDKKMRQQLHQVTEKPSIDPHGSPIPEERSTK